MTEAADLRRADYPVLRRVTTRWNDEDVYGHVNNVVYYAYVDTAVNAYLIEATGLDTRRLPAYGVVAETGCTYRRELRFPLDVEVGLRVARLGTSSVVYDLGLFQGDHVDPAAVVRFVHVYVSGDDRSVTPIPEVIRTVLTPLVAPTGA